MYFQEDLTNVSDLSESEYTNNKQIGSNLIKQSDLLYCFTVLKNIREFIIKACLQWMNISVELVTVAAFPSTYYMCILDYRIKKTLDGKMRINSENAH